MYDYMKALLQRFDTHSEQAAALEKSIEKTRKNLANRLTKSERKMLLRLSDLEDALRDETSLNSFMCGYRLASGIHDLRHTFATLALQNGMDVKTLSAMLGHVSAATTLDIYTHITDDMQRTAAANIDRGIGKAAPPEGSSEPGQETARGQSGKPSMTDFKPVLPSRRRAGTGCISSKGPNLWEGRYSPMWIDGKKHSRNVYAHTREECEEKLKVLIVEMKAELAELKRQKAEGTLPPQVTEKRRKAGRKRRRLKRVSKTITDMGTE